MIMRYSKQREALIEILKNTKSHPTADWLYTELRKKFPNVSLATVYRNLKQLTENGDILSISTGSGSEHFDGTVKPHYHFVCTRCGRVSDVDVATFDELNDSVKEKTGIDIHSHSLMFYGICSDCK